jgi:hypothetical protein
MEIIKAFELIYNMKIRGIQYNLLILVMKLSLLGVSFMATAQTIPVGMQSIDESLRDLQLQGKISIEHSLASRPFFTSKKLKADSIYKLIDSSYNFNSTIYSNNKNTWVEILPTTTNFKYNSHHPYGWNESNFIDAKGIQDYISGGIFANWGMISVQLKPELVHASNPSFETGNGYGAATKSNYNHAFLGQSSIRLNAGVLSVGVSSENMWWGNGIQNSLLMSNNAPGFNHLVINTTKPLKTPIGNFEFSLIAGKLTEDTSVLLQVKDLTTFYYAQGEYSGEPALAKLDTGDWRYLSAIYVSYNPKWIPGLFLGFTRLGYSYNHYTGNRNNFIYDYLPVFAGLFRSTSNYYTVTGNSTKIKQLISVSARYVFDESHAEIYAEYGSNDNTLNMRDFILSPNHGSIYTAGFKKLVPLDNKKLLDIQAEITNLSMPVDYLIRSTGYTYVYQGSYTNQSRVIGAGFGNGSNMQTLNVNLKNGFNKQGFTFQRIVHDALREPYLTNKQRWTDIAFGYGFQKRYQRLLFHAQALVVNSSNYGWIPNATRVNISTITGFTYFLGKNKH